MNSKDQARIISGMDLKLVVGKTTDSILVDVPALFQNTIHFSDFNPRLRTSIKMKLRTIPMIPMDWAAEKSPK